MTLAPAHPIAPFFLGEVVHLSSQRQSLDFFTNVAEALGYCNAAVLAAFAVNCNHQVQPFTFSIPFLRCNCVPPLLLHLLEYSGKLLVAHNALHVFRIETRVVTVLICFVIIFITGISKTPDVHHEIYVRLTQTTQN